MDYYREEWLIIRSRIKNKQVECTNAAQENPAKLGCWSIYMRENLQQIKNKDGLFLEFGVAGGDSLRFLNKYLPNQKIYGFDSFEGLPDEWASWPKGHFKCKIPNFNSDNIELKIGMFDKTLPSFLESHKEHISFVHIDCDLYESTKYVLEQLKDRLIAGSILCFDEIITLFDSDFAEACFNGEFKAFIEFVVKYDINYEILSHYDDAMCIVIT
jgi:hypothetical protein